ncbi:T9SS type A sorting domain-containing protein [candidate division KSB1 bacterium]|nr:T9SS type A sorting domain-containing protein [candidate division KSB1 bacterium]
MKTKAVKCVPWAVCLIGVLLITWNMCANAGERAPFTLYEIPVSSFPHHAVNMRAPTAYGAFDFNDGTVQNWTTDGPRDEGSDGPFPSNFSSSWADAVNYPTAGLADPIGNNRGSYKICNVMGHGITNPGATYWYMYWISPNLSSSSVWQDADGYNIKMLNYMDLIGVVPGTHLTLWIDCHVTVYDQDQARDRYFRGDYEEISTWLEDANWISRSFAFSGDITSIPHRTIKEIMISVRGRMSDYFEGGIYLDEVVPYGGGSGSPMISLNLTDLDFGMRDNGMSFNISNSGTGTLTWTVTESPNEAWITSVSPSTGSGNVTVNIVINRSLLTENVETGTLLVASNGGNEYVTVKAAKDTVSQWVHEDIETKLFANDGVELDQFGRAVAIEGDYAAVGAPEDDNENGVDAGAVYMFTRSGDNWTQTAKLIALDGAGEDYFGYAVDIDGDYMVVGSCWDDDHGEQSGSAYIYKRSGSTWNMQDKIAASDGGADNRFGINVAISGQFAIVGAFFDDDFGTRSGSAYIFERINTDWTEREILHADDGAANDWFGASVSIDGEYAAVGSRYDDNENGNDAGAVYIFKQTGNDWLQQKKILASDGAATDLFHIALLKGDMLVVGAYQDDDKGSNSGSIYVYNRYDTDWLELEKHTASDGAADSFFGSGLAMYDNRLVVGAYRSDDHAGNSGSIYIFEYNGSNWIETEKIISSDGDAGDYFGNPVDIYQNYVIVGVRNDDDKGNNAGAAYIYELETTPVLTVSPTTLNFGTTTNSMTFQITNAGSGTLSWNISTMSEMLWLGSVDPFVGTGNATVTVTVDRTKLTSASATGALRVSSNGGTQDVTLQIANTEQVSTPTTPNGPGTGKVGQPLSFTASGAVSNLGHPVEYQFDWGDGYRSGWGAVTQNHSYNSEGAVQVKARARCQTHTTVVSDWSTAKNVTISYCQLTLSVEPTGSGTVTKNPDKTNYSYNENVQLTATANSGYRFNSWSGDVSNSVNPQSLAMTGDKTVIAHFVPGTIGPTHFTFLKTDESYSIVINAATLDGDPLAPGDEIGVFTPARLCIGASVWSGTAPLSVVAWKDDAQTTEVIDGYRTGETMLFRMWEAGTSATIEYPATATYSIGGGTFGDGVYSIISALEARSVSEHQLVLNKGWSWISTNVTPTDANVEHIFGSSSQLAILINGAGQFYIPGVINGIGNWDTKQGYKIYVNANDALTFSGQTLAPASPISLTTGWNFVSYLPEMPIAVETALNSIMTHLVIIKQDNGNFFIPGVINGIGSMQKGEGYKLYTNSAASLIYPTGGTLAKTLQAVDDSVVHFNYAANTGESYSIVIDDVRINNEPLMPSSEVAVFTGDGLCIGAAVWTDAPPLGLVAWGDDQQTNDIVDGYVAGDTMCFRIWNAADGNIYDACATYSFGDAHLGQNIYSRVSLLEATISSVAASITGTVPDKFRLLPNYPNPFNPATTFEYTLPCDSHVRLAIFNIWGKEVKTLLHSDQAAGTYKIEWDGTNTRGVPVCSGIYVCRLSAGSYTMVRKIICLR